MLVAGQHIVEGQHAGEEAGQQQDLDHRAGPGAEVVLGGGGDHAVRVTGRGVQHGIGTPRLDNGPAGDGVEEADDGHGDVGRARDGAVRVAGLGAEHGGGLEADETGHGHHQADAHGTGEDVLGEEGIGVEPVGAAASCDDHVDDHDDGDLGDEQHAQCLRAQLDAAVAEVADDCGGGQGERPPGDADQRFDEQRELGAEEAVDGELDGGVGQQGEVGGAHAEASAEGGLHVGVEGAGFVDELRHGGQADGEEDKDGRAHGVHRGVAGTVAGGHADRQGAADDGKWGGRGDDHEDDGGRGQRAAGQVRGGVSGCGGCLVCRRW